MHALKTPSFLRPSSRPTSPSPALTRPEGVVSDRPSRTSMLSFSTFKRSASPLTRASTPLVQDGSYMEVLNLRLSEAVSKALAHPAGPGAPHEIYNGRRPIPPGRGRALGDLISSEIKASRENPHLYRAVIRTLHRPLSVLVNNLSSTLLPLISSSTFRSPVNPSPHATTWQPNATQSHALALATLAGELLDTFNELGLGHDCEMRGDGLKVVRDGLVSVVKRVTEPLVANIRSDLLPLIEALATPQRSSSGVITATKTYSGSKAIVYHPSIISLQSVMPTYARALSKFITSTAAESILASFLICLTWHGLVALSTRPIQQPSPPTSPAPKTRRGSSVTPPTTPPASRFTLKLPPSRPPSPPALPTTRMSSTTADARALYDLLASLPRPSDVNTNKLAREAVDEGFEALSCLTVLLEAVPPHLQRIARNKSSAIRSIREDGALELEKDLEVLTAELPTLIAFPVLLRCFVYPSSNTAVSERSVASMLGLSEVAYRNGCLSGFGRGEECAAAVGQRILSVLRADLAQGRIDSDHLQEAQVVMKWLERQVALASDH
ncbi:hypothetical protein ABKN59_002879 [Abortiporus biennis]